MPIYDISLPLHNQMMVFHQDPPPRLRRVQELEKGDVANVSELCMGVHSGTHLDAPIHFITGGAAADAIALEDLIGPCVVVQFPDHLQQIHAADLEAIGLPAGTRRVLFKTRNSHLWAREENQFSPDYTGVEADAAQWLIDRGVEVVGIDHLSICPFHDLHTTHRLLLQAGVIVIEGLNLTGIQPGLYQLLCLPLRIRGSDGAPCRVVLMT